MYTVVCESGTMLHCNYLNPKPYGNVVSHAYEAEVWADAMINWACSWGPMCMANPTWRFMGSYKWGF